jgi:hypothetical protein
LYYREQSKKPKASVAQERQNSIPEQQKKTLIQDKSKKQKKINQQPVKQISVLKYDKSYIQEKTVIKGNEPAQQHAVKQNSVLKQQNSYIQEKKNSKRKRTCSTTSSKASK